MPGPTAEALTALLRRHRVLDMPALRRAFPTRSRASFMRDLAAIGSLSSCNNSGGFYTLPDVPEFDADGLWRWERALFSRHGTLKATVRHLVRTADSGQTQRELQQRLQLRVHNTLLELVSAREIARELIDQLYLYVSADLEVQAAQIARRRALLRQPEHPPLGLSEVVEILLVVIHHGTHDVCQPQEVRAELCARGCVVSLAQIQDVFERYDLGKKN